jgi:hypothetical protein
MLDILIVIRCLLLASSSSGLRAIKSSHSSLRTVVLQYNVSCLAKLSFHRRAAALRMITEPTEEWDPGRWEYFHVAVAAAQLQIGAQLQHIMERCVRDGRVSVYTSCRCHKYINQVYGAARRAVGARRGNDRRHATSLLRGLRFRLFCGFWLAMSPQGGRRRAPIELFDNARIGAHTPPARPRCTPLIT